jgi:hypothetical protein
MVTFVVVPTPSLSPFFSISSFFLLFFSLTAAVCTCCGLSLSLLYSRFAGFCLIIGSQKLKEHHFRFFSDKSVNSLRNCSSCFSSLPVAGGTYQNERSCRTVGVTVGAVAVVVVVVTVVVVVVVEGVDAMLVIVVVVVVVAIAAELMSLAVGVRVGC